MEGQIKKVKITVNTREESIKAVDEYGVEYPLDRLNASISGDLVEFTVTVIQPVFPIEIERTVYNKMPAYRWGRKGEAFPYHRGDPTTKRQAQIDCFNWAIEHDLWEGNPEDVL